MGRLARGFGVLALPIVAALPACAPIQDPENAARIGEGLGALAGGTAATAINEALGQDNPLGEVFTIGAGTYYGARIGEAVARDQAQQRNPCARNRVRTIDHLGRVITSDVEVQDCNGHTGPPPGW